MLERLTGVGGRVQQERKALGLSQEGLAEKSGVSGGVIQKYEGGKDARPDALTVAQLADALGVTTDWLLLGRTPKHPPHEHLTPDQMRSEITAMMDRVMK